MTTKMVKQAFEESKELYVERSILKASTNAHDIQRREQLNQKIRTIESWSALLQPHENYIIQRHLVDKVSWSKLTDEKAELEGAENGCDERTLQRTQDRCLNRIAKFMTRKFGSTLDYLFHGTVA